MQREQSGGRAEEAQNGLSALVYFVSPSAQAPDTYHILCNQHFKETERFVLLSRVHCGDKYRREKSPNLSSFGAEEERLMQ